MKSLRLILSNPRYFGPAWVFASLNIWFGTWAIYIPTVKEQLGIDKAKLGFAIFFLSLGIISGWYFYAHSYNELHDQKYYRFILSPIWILDSQDIKEIWNMITNNWVNYYFNKPFI